MAARVTRPAVWREYMLVCKWELGISFYDVISYFTLLSMTFLAWHQHNNSRVDRFMAVSQKKKTVRQPVRHITGSDKFFSQKEEENVCVSFNHRILAWSWFMSHSVDVMRIRRKKMTVIDKCFFLPTDRLKKKKKQLTTKGTRFLEMSPSPVTMATMSREYQTEHQQHRVTEHSPHQIFAPNTKGLLNAPGQNNCFLNSAVQVSSSFLFF